jgi:LysR family glycine cleavage system transcriptional activator
MLNSVALNPRLPLQTLHAFSAVARLQNLRAAGQELHLTPSAISQQIKLLEQQAGFPLFHRRGRSVVLNDAGAALQRAVEPALDRLAEGLRAAAATAAGAGQALRITLLPSFAQRWLLPRMARWRERHPGIVVELHTVQHLVDLQRDGFHAALRQGLGHWKGLRAEPLFDSPLIAVGSPQAAARLRGANGALESEPLLGPAETWERYFALAGRRATPRPVAEFNDAGLMLQAAEGDIGIALAREVLTADALARGRLVRLSPLTLVDPQAQTMWWVHPPELAGWPPLVALHDWLLDELALSQQEVAALPLPR